MTMRVRRSSIGRPVQAAGDGSDRPDLWLASRSPRRRQLLAEHGFGRVRVVASGVDDAGFVGGPVSIEWWSAALAYLKARSAGLRLAEHGIEQGLVLGADTVVEHEGRCIGQPRDADDARRIIRLLRDGPHRVITGVALINPADDEREFLVDSANVSVGPISDESIEQYILSNGWVGKAGAYNLMERIQAGWPITFDGDPTTIMGLPMIHLVEHLARRWNIQPDHA